MRLPSRFPVLLAVGLLSFALVVLPGCATTDSDSKPLVDPGGAASDASAAVGVANGRALVDSRCSMCHNLDRVYDADKTRAEWETTVTKMKGLGLVITQEEYDAVVEYLSSR